MSNTFTTSTSDCLGSLDCRPREDVMKLPPPFGAEKTTGIAHRSLIDFSVMSKSDYSKRMQLLAKKANVSLNLWLRVKEANFVCGTSSNFHEDIRTCPSDPEHLLFMKTFVWPYQTLSDRSLGQDFYMLPDRFEQSERTGYKMPNGQKTISRADLDSCHDAFLTYGISEIFYGAEEEGFFDE